MTAPEPTLEHLAAQLREAHAKVWTPKGQRQADSTDDDYAAWVRAGERWQAAYDRNWGRGADA